MLGAIIGDIIGSRFEWHNIKTKEFELFSYKSRPTDDSIMTLALAKAILDSKDDYSDLGDLAVDSMQTWDGNIRTAAMAAALNTGIRRRSQTLPKLGKRLCHACQPGRICGQRFGRSQITVPENH